MTQLWLLPEYIEDVLPEAAWQIEASRTAVLSLLRSHGYDLVIPPHIEYLESLTGGVSDDLDLKTFKLVDQLSGRMLGLRADMTPQVARIDAHLLNREGITRLCYAGHVVHTRPNGHLSSREPLQLGAELYGSTSHEADVEVIGLAVEALKVLGVPQVQVDLGHVGIFRALCRAAGVSGLAQDDLFAALQLKDQPTIERLTADWPADLQSGMRALPTLFGDVTVLQAAATRLPALPEIQQGLTSLGTLANVLQQQGMNVSIELGELRTGKYHNGLVFSVFADGWPNPVARGGRYDNMGQMFGRARPATGFSLDLRDILRGLPCGKLSRSILAPQQMDAALQDTVAQLRAQGEVVIRDLGEGAPVTSHQLCLQDGQWLVLPRA